MTDAAEKILEDALSLPEDERRHLVEVLSHSLDADALDRVDLSPAWKAEIGRRIAEVESGAVKPVSWDEVEAKLRAIRNG
ncbi:MAG: addiction module protein [Deltaproteobacteria bacterium]|nr:addiction module protein [Deltaproteobacteria bacterium]